MSRLSLSGVGVPRSPHTAMMYLTATIGIGPWSQWLRRGLDYYLSQSHYHLSLNCYLYAAELGYEVAQSNAGFVLRRRLSALTTTTYTTSTESTEHEISYNSHTNATNEEKGNSLVETCINNDDGNNNDNNNNNNNNDGNNNNNNDGNNNNNNEQCSSDNSDFNNNQHAQNAQTKLKTMNYLNSRLLLKEYALSSYYGGNRDSTFQIGVALWKLFPISSSSSNKQTLPIANKNLLQSLISTTTSMTSSSSSSRSSSNNIKPVSTTTTNQKQPLLQDCSYNPSMQLLSRASHQGHSISSFYLGM